MMTSIILINTRNFTKEPKNNQYPIKENVEEFYNLYRQHFNKIIQQHPKSHNIDDEPKLNDYKYIHNIILIVDDMEQLKKHKLIKDDNYYYLEYYKKEYENNEPIYKQKYCFKFNKLFILDYTTYDLGMVQYENEICNKFDIDDYFKSYNFINGTLYVVNKLKIIKNIIDRIKTDLYYNCNINDIIYHPITSLYSFSYYIS